MKMWKRKIAAGWLSAVLIASMLFSGCGGSKVTAGAENTGISSSESQSASTGASSKKAASIVVWTNLENETDTLKKYGEMWANKTGNKVEVVHETADLQQLVQATKSKNGPDALYGIANDQLANYVSAGLVQEVPGDLYKNGDYANAAVQACYSDGKRYGIPIAVETNTLFYNTQKVKKAPETWDELINTAKVSGGVQFEATSIYYDLGFLRAYDSYIFKYTDGKYDIKDIGLGNENAVKSYTLLKELAVDNGFFSSDITSDLARSSFQNGKTAFYIGGPWDISGFKSAGTPFAVAPMPSLNGKPFVTPVGTQVGFVSSKSDEQEATWDFIKYLMENSAQDLYSTGGRIPANIAAQGQINADDATKAFITQISHGEPMPTVPELGQVWTPYSDNIKLMFQKKITPAEAAKNISKQVQEGIDLMNSGK
ncbi:sugar ABC transporter substrate-binding protein [Ruminiclostridium cellobioparum]|uniref:sugar ABC transporter substrate-binding protein n=2 Tax=Ruminiclostridium cellobioparum TaxID=29355 RepID=UPI00047F0FF7|nr:extracellular solute-binding protein [Ruminiclostridium cellobioparum]